MKRSLNIKLDDFSGGFRSEHFYGINFEEEPTYHGKVVKCPECGMSHNMEYVYLGRLKPDYTIATRACFHRYTTTNFTMTASGKVTMEVVKNPTKIYIEKVCGSDCNCTCNDWNDDWA